jgi:dinuclear metal center YbgI/SA1388 family protein
MNTDEVAPALEEIAPRFLAESWDNVGWQVRAPGQDLSGILLTLDVTVETVAEAVRTDCNLIFAHHPTLFKPVSSLDMASPLGLLLEQLIRHRISVWAAHTNLDLVPEGTSFALARALGLEDLTVLAAVERPGYGGAGLGFGAVGSLPATLSTADIARAAARRVASPVCQVAGQPGRLHSRVAVMGGSGGSFIGDAAASAATLFITADVRYHEAQDAVTRGLDLVVLDHFATEYPVLESVRDRLQRRLAGLPVRVAAAPSTPWVIVEP